MTIWAILPAAGIGRRMGSNTPKQYLPINGVPVIAITLSRLASVAAITEIVVVLNPGDEYWPTLAIDVGTPLSTTAGGDQRQQSVLNGLLHIESRARHDDWVLVHDAVRPCVRGADIDRLIDQLAQHPVGGLLGSKVDNTLKEVNACGQIQTTVDRNNYWNALTPQMFRYSVLKAALEYVVNEQQNVTDESAAVELLGQSRDKSMDQLSQQQPQIVEGNKDNIKITHDADLMLAAKILEIQASTT